MSRGGPVLVLNTNVKRETGRKAQLNNIKAAKTVADVIRTSLGPKAMLKMILVAHGSPLITNDGHAILRELNVAHPAAKSMLDLARTQDEEVGDGTTSVIILAGEILSLAAPWLEKQMHPRMIIGGYNRALQDALAHLQSIARPVDIHNEAEMLKLVQSCLGTKFISRWGETMAQFALRAVRTVFFEENGRSEVDIKHFVKVEKIPGGDLSDSQIIQGVVINKDVTHGAMRRHIVNPRIVLLDCNLEYKKPGNQIVKLSKAPDFEAVMREEEEYVKKLVMDIVKFKPDLVITEKGLSDEAQHWFLKHNITALRRTQRSIMNRIARATGATIVDRPADLKESDVGTRCGLFEIKKIGDEYYSYITECKESKTATIVLRGASKDVMNEVERNLQDAMAVTKNIFLDPLVVPGGGATEMSMGAKLAEKAKSIAGVEQYPYAAIGIALEVIPRTLLQNCGANIVKVLTQLRAKHAVPTLESSSWGVDGDSGQLVDMKEFGVWEPVVVKRQSVKTAIEASCMLLRIDDVLSGMGSKKEGQQEGPQGMPQGMDGEM